MLSCLKTLPPPSTTSYLSSPASQGEFVENTPRSSAQPSETIDVTQLYTRALETTSYGEIRRIFDHDTSFDQTLDIGHSDAIDGAYVLEDFLHPNRDFVQESLSTITPSPLTDLVATYFEHSEQTYNLCFLLCQKIRQARQAYAPIHDLLDCLPQDFDSDSYTLSDSQCNSAYNVFLHFDTLENPFLSHDSHNFDDMRGCFSELTHQLNQHPIKPRSRIHLPHYCSTGSAMCMIAAAVGITVTAAAIATHAVIALFGSPICFALFPLNMSKKGKVNVSQLDVASRSAYVLLKDLDTIDRLVAHLHAEVEDDKFSIHHGLERNMDRYLVQQKLKQLKRNRPSFMERLAYLEDNLFLCFAAINRTRSSVLEKIHMRQVPG